MGSKFELLVKNSQERNPVIQYLRQVQFRFSDIYADFSPEAQTCIFYLTLRHFAANPKYLSCLTENIQFERIILICCVDSFDMVSIEEINKLCCLGNISLIFAWDDEEIGRYIETVSIILNKPEETEVIETNLDFILSLSSALSELPYFTKSDVSTLVITFPNFLNMLNTPLHGFSSIPSIGAQKARYIFSVFKKPFFSMSSFTAK